MFAEKPTDRLRKAEKGERRVRDPITDSEIIVKDADPKGGSVFYSCAHVPDFDSTSPASMGKNVLHHQFPPPQPAEARSLLNKLRMLQVAAGGGLFLVWISVAFGSGYFRFLWRSAVCFVIGGGLMIGISLVERGLDKELERVRQAMGRSRGETFSPPMPESVEWLNGLIRLMWGLVDP